MGKAKKLKISGSTRHAPLGDQINTDDLATPSTRPSKDRKRTDEEDVDKFVDGKLSEKILSQARQQVKDLEAEELPAGGNKAWPKQSILNGINKETSSDEESEDDEKDTDVASAADGGFDGQGYVCIAEGDVGHFFVQRRKGHIEGGGPFKIILL